MEDKFYYKKNKKELIGQADIFSYLPFLNIGSNLVQTIEAIGEDLGYKEIDLNEYTPSQEGTLNVVTDIKLKPAIVITQNCDVLRSDFISFCEIRNLVDVEKNLAQMTNEKKKLKFYTETYAHKEKYFYLPEEDGIFENKMAVDFSRIYQIERTVLEKMLDKRLCSLGKIPLDHFRVKIAHYFKRFAHDKWYLLKKDEFASYYKEKESSGMPDCELNLIKPYPWQE